MPSLSIEQSGAFIKAFNLEPTTDGPLAGLRFAVKDLIDVAGHRTGCGNPDWLATHPPAASHAVCVEQLLASGATCVGKTVTDEVAFSLIGENHFYGTPLNPAAPDRVPGGSSSGSASAVACGLADFALGTDTGGSVRVPANNCGTWGLRPSHDLISVAGVMPFAPTFDTVGILARSIEVLQRAATALIGDTPSDEKPATIHLVTEAFSLADPEVRQALEAPLARLRSLAGWQVRETSLAELCQNAEAADMEKWYETYCVLQWAEIGSSLGSWIEASKPTFGPVIAGSLELVANLDRRRIAPAVHRRERLCRQLERALRRGDLLCLPTTPAVAPLKGTITGRQAGTYYHAALSLTSIAGISRLPQVSMPMANLASAPLGLSLVAAHGEDLRLLQIAARLAK